MDLGTFASAAVACNGFKGYHVACNREHVDMADVNSRVQKHRAALRMAGLRPVQIWVPDTRRPGFADECRRQSRLAALADQTDTVLQHLMDEALGEIEGWTE
ncbi:hypothetical protein GCM10027288_01680 [Bordetella tumbae]